jgi:hypothetical protein
MFINNLQLSIHNNNSNNNNKNNNSKIILNSFEPNLVIFHSIPFLFEIKLNIYFIDGEMNDFKIINFSNYSNSNKIIINLGYFYNNYYLLYFKENFNENVIKNYNNFEIIKNNFFCSNCKNKDIFIKHKKIFFCFECFNNKIKEIFKNRTINIIKENFINFSFYLRNLNLKINNENIFFSNEDCKKIFNKNFFNFILSNIFSICKICYKFYENNNNINTLNCNCLICNFCLLNEIKKITNNKIILNIFEKKNKNFQCLKCKEKFNLNEYLNIIKNKNLINFKDFKQQAKNRLKKYVLIYCLNCLNFCSDNNNIDFDVNSKKIMNYKFSIKISKKNKENKEENIDYYEGTHLICSNCYKNINLSYNFFDNDEIHEKSFDLNEYLIIYCKICQLDHLIQKDEWEVFKYKDCCKTCILL